MYVSDPDIIFITSIPNAGVQPSGVCNNKGNLLTNLSTSVRATAKPWLLTFASSYVFCITPCAGIACTGIPSPNITVPVVGG